MLTKETLVKLEEMASPQIWDYNENLFVITREGEIEQIREALDYAGPINLYSLDALIQMVNTEALKLYGGNIYIAAHSHNSVECFLQPNSELRHIRQYLYEVKAKDVPGELGAAPIPYEEALIALRTRFIQTVETEYLLKLLSEITNGAEITFSGNGIATNILTKTGVDLKTKETVRPIISLAPYRTFQEITQPESLFHIRVSKDGIRFIEADGGMWKLAARKTIVEYIKEHLSEAVADGRVVVML